MCICHVVRAEYEDGVLIHFCALGIFQFSSLLLELNSQGLSEQVSCSLLWVQDQALCHSLYYQSTWTQCGSPKVKPFSGLMPQ